MYTDIDNLLSQTNEDAIEEVKEKYEPFEKNMNSLLDAETLESYLDVYEEMNKEDSAVLKCYNLDTTEELKAYVEKNEVDFDTLKTETVHAACQALKFVIYDSEEDDDY
jgi:hypothetical protein